MNTDIVPYETFLSEFRQAVTGPDEEIDLARAALQVARVEYPDLDVEGSLDGLNALAARAQARCGASRDPMDGVRALIGVVIKDLGLRGAPDGAYYDPRNSFLNDVLERRIGIPISLSILLMGVGQRAGIPLAGTSVPMHFLVRVLGVDPPRFVDCYEGGQILTVEDCRETVRVLSRARIAFQPMMLDVIPNIDILTRFLTNLKLIYLNAGHYAKAAPILDRLLILNANSPALLRERGLTHYRLGQSAYARHDLRDYLAAAPDAPDARQIRDLLRRIK